MLFRSFYGQSVLQVMDAGDHKGLPQKCQACRRIHERMTVANHQGGHAAATARERPAPPGAGPPVMTDEDPVTGDLREYPDAAPPAGAAS